jgi:small membrane protein
MTFKYFLVSVLTLFIFYLLLLPRKTDLRKGFILAFVFLMLTFSVKPDWSSAIANLVGIARGVDLLFYLSHLMLFFIAFLYYLKFKDIELRFTKLVRQLALENARAHLPGRTTAEGPQYMERPA